MARSKKLYENDDTLLILENDVERCLCGIFKDGHALCTDIETNEAFNVTYPKYHELTDEQKSAIEDVCLRPIEAYFDIAVVYGEIERVNLNN